MSHPAVAALAAVVERRRQHKSSGRFERSLAELLSVAFFGDARAPLTRSLRLSDRVLTFLLNASPLSIGILALLLDADPLPIRVLTSLILAPLLLSVPSHV